MFKLLGSITVLMRGKEMKFRLLKIAILSSAVICLLIYNGQNARAGTQGVEQFNLIDRVQQDLTFVEDGTNSLICFCGPFDGEPEPPPQTIIHGNTPFDGQWFVGGPEPLNLGWFVTYGVQTPTDQNVFSQYCTMKADTAVTSNLTEDVDAWCWTSPDQTTRCPTCDVMSFLDYYTFDSGEGGLFEISPLPSLAAVAEPTSMAILGGSISLMGLVWVRRRRWLHRCVWKGLARGA
jgi:hypothetical protein